jgi:hypothetical protein
MTAAASLATPCGESDWLTRDPINRESLPGRPRSRIVSRASAAWDCDESGGSPYPVGGVGSIVRL